MCCVSAVGDLKILRQAGQRWSVPLWAGDCKCAAKALGVGKLLLDEQLAGLHGKAAG